MTELWIRLSNVDNVKSFVNIVTRFNCEIDIISDRYVVDAKSIMGIFSLDLSKPVLLKINSDDADETVAVKEGISEFIADRS